MSNNSNYKQVQDLLNAKKLRATQQRVVIYHYLLNTKSHPTTEEVFQQIKDANPSISLATVYKTMESLEAYGLINKVSSKGGSMRYDANIKNHNHIYCVNTNEIIDYEDEELSELIHNYLKNKQIENLNIEDIRVHITGNKVETKKGITIK